jgi:spore maturation protein CgeB
MSRYDLSGYDGVLAFGASVAEVYRRNGWGKRVWVWHEAADVRRFKPIAAAKEGDLVWIGNWGDDERSAELHEFLIEPVRQLGLRAKIHGVRYPGQAREALSAAGIDYGGWAPNFDVPQIFARYRLTVHVPRRPYATALPGVPTIRIFEALACGMPLVSAPWSDSEGLFSPGEDFLFAANGEEMRRHLRMLLSDNGRAADLGEHGRRTILARHTCAHRVKELYSVVDEIRLSTAATVGGLN